jgi:hypothetical protein
MENAFGIVYGPSAALGAARNIELEASDLFG